MPELNFKGKQHIYAHHMTVPYRPLLLDKKGSLLNASAAGEGNLIINGDNLHALKALLPRYAGRVKCIYIDPPYNTGNEGWIYSDNVNSPLMQSWLEQNGLVDGEDMERHDKWLCMMWPRLQLLKELLSDDGVIFVSIDDHEQHHLRMLMDEIFGAENFIAQIVVQTNPRGRSLRRDVAQTHEYVLMYAKDAAIAEINKMPKSERALSEYTRQDENGSYRLLRLRNTGVQFFNRETRPNLYFPIYVNPSNGMVSLSRGGDFSVEVLPVTDEGIEGCWTWGKEKIEENPSLIVGQKVRGGQWRIYRKDYLEGENWDLVVFDEAHRLTAKTYGHKTEKTLNYRLAEALCERTRDFLFLTGTPHDGNDSKFRDLLKSLDPEVDFDSSESERFFGKLILKNRKSKAIGADGRRLFKDVQVKKSLFLLCKMARRNSMMP